MARITQQSSIGTTGTSFENEPIVKSDGASSDVMEWAASTGSSAVKVTEGADNKLDLTVDGKPVVAGVQSDGAGLHFQGGAIDIASPPDLGTKFSFEFVLKADEWPTTSDNDLIHFGNGGNFLFYGNDSAGGNLGIADGGAFKDFGVAILDDLKVHHLVLTVNGTAAILYDNGNQVATVTISASHGIDSCSDAKIGSNYASATTDNFNGTIYRARFYNKALTSTEVQTAFERADVDYADQYGSQTIVIPGDFDGNLDGWDTSSIWNSQTNPSNNMVLAASATGQWCRTAVTLTKGFKYRVTYTASSLTGSPFFAYAQSGVPTVIPATSGSTTITAGTNSAEFTLPNDSNPTYFYIASGTASDAVTLDNVSVVRIGCVSDYDLAFANPTQSLTVQNRAGLPDGEASSSAAVTQVQPIIQGNLTSLKVGSGAAAAPADGQVLVDGGVVGAPAYSFTHTTNTGMWSRGGGKLDLSAGGVTRLYIEPSGDISFFEDTGASAKLRWDAADERLNLTGSDYQFSIKNGVNEAWYLRSESTGNFAIHRNTAGNILDIASTGLATFSNGINLGGTTLENYDEGTWDVGFHDATSGGNASSTTVTGNYTRVGRLVTVAFLVFDINISGMTSGNIMYFGLPFAVGSIVCIGSATTRDVEWTSGTTINCAFNTSTQRGSFVAAQDNGAWSYPTVGDFSGTGDVYVTGQYMI